MSHRTETAEFTVLCLIHDKDRILLQDRISEDWKGYTLPGGHVVFLFETDEYSGDLVSSEEGAMHWVSTTDLDKVNTVDDLPELLEVMTDEKYNEFQYVVTDGIWNIIRK